MKINIIFILLFFHFVHTVICVEGNKFVVPDGSSKEEMDNHFGVDQSERISAVEDEIQDLLGKIDQLQKAYPKQFQTALEKSSNNSDMLRISNRYTLPPICARLILQKDFDSARTVLNVIYHEDYKEVVKEAFRNTSTSFRSIVDFADTLGNEHRTFIIYKSLRELTKSENYSNMRDSIYMLTKIIDRKCFPAAFIGHIVAIFGELWEAGFFLVRSFSILSFNKIYRLEEKAGLQIISQFVELLCTKGGPTQKYNISILRFSSLVLPLQIRALVTFVNTALQLDDVFEYDVVNSVLEFKSLLESVKVEDHNNSSLIDIQDFKDKLPEMLKVLLSSDMFCIRNQKSGNYLKASNAYNGTERSVIVSQGDKAYLRTKWRFGSTVFDVDILFNAQKNEKLTVNSECATCPKKATLINRFETYFRDLVLARFTGDAIILNYNDVYLFDDEGLLGTTKEREHDFAKWIIEEC